ncbi:MAG TPA: DMT family transporter [Candidatus Limiplasma sp.]|nr:DMT family transporter [Candidatus Limiplasma sp.]HRX07751.1 DMT family transporter [Candidatus Limiplasma sp.]
MQQASASEQRLGHLLAIGTIIVWGLTFVSSTVILQYLSPVELLILRIVIGIIALTAIRPKRMKLIKRSHEFYFMGAGFFAVTMYFLLENSALTFTSSSNCAVIVSSAPFFIAIFASVFLKEEKLTPLFFVGFALAIVGLGMVSFAGQKLELNPLGDVLSLLTAISWGIATMFMRKIEKHGYPVILVTRKLFMYGVLFALPTLLFMPRKGQWADLLRPEVWMNVLFLGVVASAICYITWMMGMKRIGVVRSGTYIYLIPIVTMLGAVVLIQDTITLLQIGGALLTMAGLFLSQWHKKKPKKPLEHIEETTMHAG